MPDPAAVGARVLAAFERGRRIAIDQHRQRAAPMWRAVRREFDVDLIEQHPERGRAGRIARRLRRRGLTVSERHVRRILDALYSASGFAR